jgi:flagellar basal body rod protein FlgF
MFIPIQQYAAQSAADNLNVWRQQYAQQQAAHSSSMANTAYQLQREQADEAKAMAVKQQGLAARNAATARNAGAFASSRSGNPFASGIAARRRSTFI